MYLIKKKAEIKLRNQDSMGVAEIAECRVSPEIAV